MTTPQVEEIDNMSMGKGVGRAVAIGALIGFLLFAVVGGGIGLLAGMDLAPTAGLAAFAGIWGGQGFGAMLGGILAVTRDERALVKAR